MSTLRGRARIVILGYIVRGPLGGLAWHHLQYAMGLARLGHDVQFLEDSGDYPACYDPSRGTVGTDPSYGLRFAGETFKRVGLHDRWAYYDAQRGAWEGPGAQMAAAWARDADILFNLSGVNPLRVWHRDIPIRVFVDTDPGFTQARIISDPATRQLARAHTHFMSFATALGHGAQLPPDGFPWRPTRQPVVLEAWPFTAPPDLGRLTTVMQWESYPEAVYGGLRLGLKSRSFGSIERLPEHFPGLLEVALGTASAPRDELTHLGWHITDPLAVTRDPWAFQDYLRKSLGEFSVAKEGYVSTRSGWFSERSTSYMAMGRPVVVQDTGFTCWIPAGEGLLAFDNEDSAAAAIDSVLTDPVRHGSRARELVRTYFDSNRVLTDLLESVSHPQEAFA